MTQIGVLGGTFDPPHYGHLILAEQARDQLQLGRVLWVPAALPPHKQDGIYTSVEHRLEMVRLAIHHNPAFSISLVDVSRPGPHYTVDMLALLQYEYPGAPLLFLIGGDSLHDLPTWHEPARLIELARLVIMRRPGDNVDLDTIGESVPRIRERCMFLDIPLIEISAHTIRRRVQEGRSIRYLVPESVRSYIESSHLYKSHAR